MKKTWMSDLMTPRVNRFQAGAVALWLAIVPATIIGATACANWRPAANAALTAVQISCIFASEIEDSEQLTEACGVAKALIPTVRKLISQRNAARRAGVHWTSADDAGVVYDSTEAGK